MITIHAARPNITENRLRISVDYRYQGVSQPVVPDSLEPHYGRLTWEDIYTDWTSDLPYYWRDLPLTYADSDPRVTAVREAALSSPRTEGETT